MCRAGDWVSYFKKCEACLHLALQTSCNGWLALPGRGCCRWCLGRADGPASTVHTTVVRLFYMSVGFLLCESVEATGRCSVLLLKLSAAGCLCCRSHCNGCSGAPARLSRCAALVCGSLTALKAACSVSETQVWWTCNAIQHTIASSMQRTALQQSNYLIWHNIAVPSVTARPHLKHTGRSVCGSTIHHYSIVQWQPW
jgi:hypothetical protein